MKKIILILLISLITNLSIAKKQTSKQDMDLIKADLYLKNKDYAKAFTIYDALAKQNNNTALVNLGLFYEKGYAVKQDYEKAKSSYIKALKNNTSSVKEAKYNLALLYIKGLGTKQNVTLAEHYFAEACHDGLEIACNNKRKIINNDYAKIKYKNIDNSQSCSDDELIYYKLNFNTEEQLYKSKHNLCDLSEQENIWEIFNT